MPRILLVVAILTSAYLLVQVFQYFGRRPARKTSSDPFNLLAAVTMLNYVVFALASATSGGSALHGKIVGDQYFLGDHGRYTAVSHTFWLLSYAHGWITFSLFAATLLGLVIGAITGSLNLPSNGDDHHPRGRGTV